MAKFVVFALALPGTVPGSTVSEGSLHFSNFSRPRSHRFRGSLSGFFETCFLVALLERPSHQLVEVLDAYAAERVCPIERGVFTRIRTRFVTF